MPTNKCPMSNLAIEQIKDLSASYKLALEAAAHYNAIALANKKQIESALALADRLRQVLEGYLRGWEQGFPCLTYSCGWEYCQRNLQILNSLPNLPDPPGDPGGDIHINATQLTTDSD